jgi:hypothetical protein
VPGLPCALSLREDKRITHHSDASRRENGDLRLTTDRSRK